MCKCSSSGYMSVHPTAAILSPRSSCILIDNATLLILQMSYPSVL